MDTAFEDPNEINGHETDSDESDDDEWQPLGHEDMNTTTITANVELMVGHRNLSLKSERTGHNTAIYSKSISGMEEDDVYPFFLDWFEIVIRMSAETVEEMISMLELHDFVAIIYHFLGDAFGQIYDDPQDDGQGDDPMGGHID